MLGCHGKFRGLRAYRIEENMRRPFRPSARRITGQAQKVEIISAKEPRRRWSNEEKRRRGTDVLGRINGHPASWLDELLPWNWTGRSARLIA